MDHIELESIRKRSKLNKEQALKLAKEVEREVWRKGQNAVEVE